MAWGVGNRDKGFDLGPASEFDVSRGQPRGDGERVVGPKGWQAQVWL